MADYRAMARDAATAHGLPSDRFERQIGVESINYDERVITCRLDSGAGARGIAQLMPVHWSQVDPCDPHAALDYAARLMRGHLDYWLGQGKDAETAYGLALSSYNAGRQATIDGLAGRKAWWPFSETVTYLVRIMGIDEGQAKAIMTGGTAPMAPALPFIADAPIDQQPDDWSCALQSVQWLLRSVGRNPDASNPDTDPWLRSQLVPGIISPDVGLRDGSGQPLAAWLNREYGVEGGWTAYAVPVEYDDVLAGAGINPTMIGGHHWGPGGHWSGVRGRDGDDLLLANPANGYTGIGQRMTRAEWAARGPWHAIYIDRQATLPAPEPAPVFDKRAVIAALREILARHEAYDRDMRERLAALIELAGAA